MRKRKFPTVFFLIVALLLLGGATGLFWSEANPGLVEDIALKYFDAVKSGEYTKAYYEYTSTRFQGETSLDAFKKGLKGYTFFENAGTIQVNHRNIEEDIAFLEGIVKSNHGSQAPISFWLVKEGDEWKINRIESEKAVESVKKQHLLDQLKAPVLAQMNAIRRGDLKQAYQEGTSEEFRRATDFPHFVRFVSTFPIIGKSQSEEFLEVNEHAKQATLDLALTDNEESVRLIYELIKDKEQWRIFSFQVIPYNEGFLPEEDDLAKIEIVIKDQIQQIKEGHSESAYQNTSPALKAGTSYFEFKTFFESYPFFKEDGEYHIKTWIDTTIGKAVAKVIAKQDTHFLDFTLYKEKGQWKIWGIEIDSQGSYEKSQDEKSAINVFLAKLEERNLKEAFEHSLSAEFKSTTSFEDFQRLILTELPFALKHKSKKIIETVIQGDSAVAQVEFFLDDGNSEILEFEMVKELGMWKIIGIKLMKTAETELNED